jgi:DNA-directed RNA polymerase subunit RPC12/RpoP
LWEVIGIEEWLSNARFNEGSHNDSFQSLNQGSTSLGLSEVFINHLPKEKFVPNATGSSIQDCSICLEEFQLGQKLVCLPCNHKFHPKCLTPWLESHVQCPYCRAKINIVGKGHIPRGQDNASIHDLFALMEVVDSGMSRLNIA